MTTNKQKIFSITQVWWNRCWFDWTDEEIKQPWKFPRTCSVNQKGNSEKNGIAIEEMHAIYHDKDSKTHWTITYKETVYKDIHIHVLIKTVGRTRSWKYKATAIGLQPGNIEYAKRGKYACTTCWAISFMKDYQNINMQQVTFWR